MRGGEEQADGDLGGGEEGQEGQRELLFLRKPSSISVI